MSAAGLVRLAIRVRAADAEIALARLLPVVSSGAEERSFGDAVEYALYGEAASLPSEAELRALAGDALLDVAVSPVIGGWETAWHAHLGRVCAGGFAVRPPWVPGEPDDLVVEPGTAFGAGGHPTTRLCLELLGELETPGALCDWGAGSGVLAIAAARLGFRPVTAVDVDPAAVELARRNAEANGVVVDVRCGDVRDGAPWAPTVVANLTLPLLEAAVPARPPERMIASGLLAEQAFVPAGMVVRERRELEGWAAVVLEAV